MPKSKPKSMLKPIEREQANKSADPTLLFDDFVSLKERMHRQNIALKPPKGVRGPFASRKKRRKASTQNEQTKQGIKQHGDDRS